VGERGAPLAERPFREQRPAFRVAAGVRCHRTAWRCDTHGSAARTPGGL